MSHRTSSRAACAIALCFALALLAAPLPAAAQRLIVSYSPAGFFTPPVTLSWNVAAREMQWTESGVVEGQPVFTSDGRYLVFRPTVATGAPLRVLDVVTRGALDLAVDFEPGLAHPRRTEIFGLTAFSFSIYGKTGTVARLDATGLTRIGGCAPGTTRHIDLTADGAQLLALCNSGELAVVETASGAVLRTVPLTVTAGFLGMHSNHDGSRALVPQPGASGTVLALVDTTTGATVQTTVFPASGGAPECGSGSVVGASPDKRIAVLACSTDLYRTRLLDIDTLTWGADLGVVFDPRLVGISPDNTIAFTRSIGPQVLSVLQLIHLPTNTTIASFSGMTFSIAMAFAPLAPSLTASESGSRVDLQWTLPVHSPAATRYVVEVGSATGLSNLGTLELGPLPTLLVPTVPPGTYVVRVRAANATGVGAASNEVVLTVP